MGRAGPVVSGWPLSFVASPACPWAMPRPCPVTVPASVGYTPARRVCGGGGDDPGGTVGALGTAST